jgi:hypothetical protein
MYWNALNASSLFSKASKPEFIGLVDCLVSVKSDTLGATRSFQYHTASFAAIIGSLAKSGFQLMANLTLLLLFHNLPYL